MADYTIQISGWWTDDEELDDYVYTLIEDNTPADPSAIIKKYTLTYNDINAKEYDCDWDGDIFTVRIEVI